MMLYQKAKDWLWVIVFALLVILTIMSVPKVLSSWYSKELPMWVVVLVVISAPVAAFLIYVVTLLDLQWERKASLLRFPSRSTMDAFLTNLLKERGNGKMCIDVANFTQYPPQSREGKEYMLTIKKCISKNKNIKLRRLVIFPTLEKVKWANEWARELGRCPNFEMKYLRETCGEKKLALFMPTFYIVDSKVLFVGFFSEEEATLNLLVKNPGLANEFGTYFETLWEKALPIKSKSVLGEVERRRLFKSVIEVFREKELIDNQEFQKIIEELE